MQATPATDLSTWTPAQIDNALADIYGKAFPVQMAYYAAHSKRIRALALDHHGAATTHRETMARAQATLAELDEQARPLEAQFSERRWTRAWKVPGGHVHRTDTCHTCHRQGQVTDIRLVPDWSGRTETEIVDAAGEGACTVCFPSAPVDEKRPCQIWTSGEQAQEQARAEREAAKAQRAADIAAKAIANPDGTPLKTEGYGLIRTLRTAEIEYVDLATRIEWIKKTDLPGKEARIRESRADIELITQALMAKLEMTDEQVKAHMALKVARRLKADARAARR